MKGLRQDSCPVRIRDSYRRRSERPRGGAWTRREVKQVQASVHGRLIKAENEKALRIEGLSLYLDAVRLFLFPATAHHHHAHAAREQGHRGGFGDDS
jgi:hypothetical protein